MPDVLDAFGAATREWFVGAFRAPTAAQSGAWAAIAKGQHALVVAPTGSGKTLASFLWAIDRLANRPADAVKGTRVLYVSPLKALGVDVERNLRSPLVGVTQTAKRLGQTPPPIRVGVRSGDTSQAERRALSNDPPEILITTPESLFLMLTSAARETLATVDTVIVDEVHAVAATKRGSHLALSLERLDAMLERPAQRIGLSATVKPVEEVARFLGGRSPVTIVAPKAQKTFDLTVVVPVDDMSDPDLGSGWPGPTDAGSDAPRSGVAAVRMVKEDDAQPHEGSAAQDVFDPDDPLPQRTGSIWPYVESTITDLVLEHRSSIVFTNSRRQAERLTARLNEEYQERVEAKEAREAVEAEQPVLATALAGRGTPAPAAVMAQSGSTRGATEVLARAHHGSVSKEQRGIIEDDLKSGRLRCVVATSSLELGIDMGAVDLVVQVGAPPSVASGLQRVGRAGHQVGEISTGVVFPVHQADLIHAAVATDRMLRGEIEALRIPANPLDVLAQQTVAACAIDELEVEAWFDTVRRSAPFAALPRSAYEAVLDLLAGRYPSDEFAELRPRIVWDRDAGTITGRPGAQRLAVTSGGTIPDRGLFGVFLVSGGDGGGNRVGELDEEMVYESRVGDVFSLGATSWRIQEITHDRVLVLPAFGEPGRVPFWKGDGLGRPAELGRAVGAFQRTLAGAKDDETAAITERIGLDERAATNLVRFIRDQAEATGSVPSDRTLVLERFRDELGDWRIVLHSPFGMQVHAPWALAVGARLSERFGIENGAMAADDGIVLRVPDTDAEPPGADLFLFEPDELDQVVTTEVTSSAIFASRFRECAARALLLPRYNPGRRSPLWQQRQRASQLLDVAKKFPTFPIIFETIREVLQDVYDLPALKELAAGLESRAVRVVEVETPTASPFARSLLFSYVGAFLYEGDSPLAERKAQALALDSTLLSELLGRVELRELLDPGVVEQTERELQRLAADRRLSGVEGAADLLRLLGPLTVDELAARLHVAVPAGTAATSLRDASEPADRGPVPATSEQAAAWVAELVSTRRAIEAGWAGEQWVAAIEDASRLRDALGVPLPIGVPIAFVEPVADPLGDLVGRYARTHGPFTAAAAALRLGLGVAVVTDTLRRLADERRVSEGEFRPGGTGTEWCDVEVLRRLRRRSLAALRKEVEPVEQPAFARFLPEWQHVGQKALRGVDGVATVIEQLAGVPVPASAWESLILPARVRDYSPAMLDELTATGEVVWSGTGRLAGNDGWIALHLADALPVTLPDLEEGDRTPLEQEVLATLGGGGAYFFRQLADTVGATNDDTLTTALWNLVWDGLVTNDTFAPVRALTGAGHTSHRTQRRAPRARSYRGRGRPAMPVRSGPPTAAGRWAILPLPESDATVRAAATAEVLLDRYGVVTRGAVQAEQVPGGFALVYKTLAALEEAGRARRGYFVEHLGAAQFSTAGTVDRLRKHSREAGAEVDDPAVLALAATDPANPYGAALPWPENDGGHRPGRKAGALVVLVDGALTAYVERGGRTVLLFDADETNRRRAAEGLAAVVHAGGVPQLVVEKVDGEFALGSPFGRLLEGAGFAATPKGLRLRA
ncbi:Lhr family ATP-dependent helicase [Amnibacterium setariae]|uniref:ATP-dependent helicase n=1 Tax=Amnibacterium setariae TaxID=2306585 RepID=A0A3A1U5H3_9MICO|nr:DEAD/DEAH box helicase [Amnibacterium setariae]RIX30258.1 ATP-dependent helicase [Amnibacterium setariae]